ncbi:proton-coupled amino acid transporter-like protein CG1139 [Drosophila ficusphila]|uniref:proton-coupled amino acid transporter-like protein CG1139 n=1 Tax=Drosophila ficusphila TaxID=30025 RepID=UPI0007E73ADF|nr:proton-coupled amino acid transporter-like protein CG1139 [Drosophila ficusphila]
MKRKKRKLNSHRRLNQELSFHQRLLGGVQRSFGSPLANQADFSSNKDKFLSDFETFINVLKCGFGTGCLAMPQAFLHSGWLMGLISCFLLSAFVLYAMHILLHRINELGNRFENPLLSYQKAVELAVSCGPPQFQFMSKPFGYLVDVLLCAYHFGVDCVYVIFIAKSLKHLGDIYLWPLDERLYMAFLALPLVLAFLIRDLKSLVPFALVSNILLILGYCIIFSYFFYGLPNFNELQATQPIRNFPLFFGTVLFAIESVGVILALGRSMQTPQNFLGPCGVLNQGMFFVIIFYAVFGFFGYWRYGQKTANSVLQNLPEKEILPQLVTVMFAMAIFFSYALQGYVNVDIIWRNYLEPKLEEGASKAVEFLVRIAFVIASVLVAIQYPDFGLLLSFVGSFCLAQLGLILPGIVDICVLYERGYGPGRIFLFRSMLFIFVGLAGGLAGTVITMRTLHGRFPVDYKYY